MSPGTTGSRCRPGFPESPWTAGSRYSGGLRKPEVPGDYGNLEYWVIPGTRNSVWLRESEVLGESPQFLLIPGTRSCLQIPGVLGYSVNPDFLATRGNRSSGSLQELGFPGGFWNADFRVPKSGISDFLVILITRSSLWLREPRVLGESGNLYFRVIPRTWSSGKSGNPVKPGNWSAGWFRNSGIFGWLHCFTHNSGLPQSPGNPETRFSCWLPDSGNVLFRVTPGTQCVSRKPLFRIPGDSWNAEFRGSAGTRSFR